jgi:shikimate kinase
MNGFPDGGRERVSGSAAAGCITGSPVCTQANPEYAPAVYQIPKEANRGCQPAPESTRLMKNIVLIGMPGAGKSTAGVILAKALRRHFIDTDILIQEQAGRLLQEIIDTDGPEAFKKLEEETVLSLRRRNAVIATGGSVVFSRRAMEHLKKDGIVVYLKISFEEMEQRLRNITTRGIVLSRGETLRGMYDRRVPLYEEYADLTVACSGEDFETVVGKVIDALPGKPGGRA